MRRTIGAVLLVLTLLLGVGVAPAIADAPVGATVQTLYAGQDVPVGSVTVWNDTENLYVDYVVDVEAWVITETHLEVVCDPAYFPVNKSGNPQVGHFTYGETLDPPDTEWSQVIDLDDICGTSLFIAAHAVVVGPNYDESPYYASEVQSYDPTSNANKTDPNDALGAPDSSGAPDWTGHVNLGYGGSLTVAFDCPVFNGDGEEDISVHEVSPAGSAAESADVYVIVDGFETYVGTVDNSGITSPDWTKLIWVSIPDGLAWVDAVKIVDTSSAGYNGFDVDAVDAPCLAQWGTAWADGSRFVEKGNWAMYFMYCVKDWVLLETLSVSANDTDATASNTVLETGEKYLLKASGVADAGDSIYFDAKYSLTTKIPGDTWTDTVSGYESYGPTLLDLFVNGASVDWGAYSEDNTYLYEMAGSGNTIDLWVYDIYPSNNTGSLTVELYGWQCPE